MSESADVVTRKFLPHHTGDLTFFFFSSSVNSSGDSAREESVGGAPAKFAGVHLIAASHGTCGASAIKPSPRTGLIVRE